MLLWEPRTLTLLAHHVPQSNTMLASALVCTLSAERHRIATTIPAQTLNTVLLAIWVHQQTQLDRACKLFV